MKEPRIVLLGTGTGAPDADRDCTHLVWDGPGGPFLVDAGGSTFQRLLKAGVDPTGLAGILITHTHCDHVNGLPALLFSAFLAGRRDPQNPIPVYGLPSVVEFARRLVEAMDLEGYAAAVRWSPLEAGDTIALPGGAWTLRTALTVHPRPCLALRWQEEGTGRAVVYSCDTAPCPAVEALAVGAEVLIHEATTRGSLPGVHSSPGEAGGVAVRAGAKRLVLVHYSPRWTLPETETLDQVRASGFTGIAEIGRDGQEIVLSTTLAV